LILSISVDFYSITASFYLNYNYQQRISWLSHRWRTQRTAIFFVTCRCESSIFERTLRGVAFRTARMDERVPSGIASLFWNEWITSIHSFHLVHPRLPAELKHINKRRKTNQQGLPQ